MTKRFRYSTLLITGLVVLAICGYIWHNFLQDRIFPRRFGVVVPGLVFRSGQISPTLIEKVLREHHIKVVVNLQFDDDSSAQRAETRAIEHLGITQYRFPLDGNGTGDIKHYAAAIARIQQSVDQKAPVLVHCAAGTQRTGGVIAAWQTLVRGQSVGTAIAGMEKYDWKPVKDRILVQFLDNHMQVLAQDLVDLHVIDKVPAKLPDFEGYLKRRTGT